jgi:hypothetical protein
MWLVRGTGMMAYIQLTNLEFGIEAKSGDGIKLC